MYNFGVPSVYLLQIPTPDLDKVPSAQAAQHTQPPPAQVCYLSEANLADAYFLQHRDAMLLGNSPELMQGLLRIGEVQLHPRQQAAAAERIILHEMLRDNPALLACAKLINRYLASFKDDSTSTTRHPPPVRYLPRELRHFLLRMGAFFADEQLSHDATLEVRAAWHEATRWALVASLVEDNPGDDRREDTHRVRAARSTTTDCMAGEPDNSAAEQSAAEDERAAADQSAEDERAHTPRVSFNTGRRVGAFYSTPNVASVQTQGTSRDSHWINTRGTQPSPMESECPPVPHACSFRTDDLVLAQQDSGWFVALIHTIVKDEAVFSEGKSSMDTRLSVQALTTVSHHADAMLIDMVVDVRCIPPVAIWIPATAVKCVVVPVVTNIHELPSCPPSEYCPSIRCRVVPVHFPDPPAAQHPSSDADPRGVPRVDDALYTWMFTTPYSIPKLPLAGQTLPKPCPCLRNPAFPLFACQQAPSANSRGTAYNSILLPAFKLFLRHFKVDLGQPVSKLNKLNLALGIHHWMNDDYPRMHSTQWQDNEPRHCFSIKAGECCDCIRKATKRASAAAQGPGSGPAHPPPPPPAVLAGPALHPQLHSGAAHGSGAPPHPAAPATTPASHNVYWPQDWSAGNATASTAVPAAAPQPVIGAPLAATALPQPPIPAALLHVPAPAPSMAGQGNLPLASLLNPHNLARTAAIASQLRAGSTLASASSLVAAANPRVHGAQFPVSAAAPTAAVLAAAPPAPSAHVPLAEAPRALVALQETPDASLTAAPHVFGVARDHVSQHAQAHPSSHPLCAEPMAVDPQIASAATALPDAQAPPSTQRDAKRTVNQLFLFASYLNLYSLHSCSKF